MALTTLKQSRRGSVLRSFGELDKAAPRFAHTLVPISRGNPFMHRKQAKRRAPEPMSQALFQVADSASLRPIIVPPKGTEEVPSPPSGLLLFFALNWFGGLAETTKRTQFCDARGRRFASTGSLTTRSSALLPRIAQRPPPGRRLEAPSSLVQSATCPIRPRDERWQLREEDLDLYL